jgi:hypothetical protein
MHHTNLYDHIKVLDNFIEVNVDGSSIGSFARSDFGDRISTGYFLWIAYYLEFLV